MKFNYRLQDLDKFGPETWIDYVEVFSMGTYFRHRIKDIPDNHLISRFNLVPLGIVNILNYYLRDALVVS